MQNISNRDVQSFPKENLTGGVQSVQFQLHPKPSVEYREKDPKTFPRIQWENKLCFSKDTPPSFPKANRL